MRPLFTFARLTCTFLGLLVLVVSLTPLVSWLTRHMTVDWYEGDADVLVVLGGSMLVPGAEPDATLGYDSYLRCVYASWDIRRFRYRYIVVTGSDGLGPAMAKYLEGQGTAPPAILVENAARTTYQNAEFVKKILDHQPGLTPNQKIAVLTSDYHTSRARLVFEHLGMHVQMIPVPDAAKRAGNVLQRWPAFLDITSEVVKDCFYKLTGKI
jgi:uncharacterized SAM-binding protein YcdF (DUF218 family)